jgi:hypothetical protein
MFWQASGWILSENKQIEIRLSWSLWSCILTRASRSRSSSGTFETLTMTDDLIGMGRILLDKGVREVAIFNDSDS